MNNRENMLRAVQIADFELLEANLYLDAYPYCSKALEYFYSAREKANNARKHYEQHIGPLTANSNTGNSWDWIDSPWPWECEG